MRNQKQRSAKFFIPNSASTCPDQDRILHLLASRCDSVGFLLVRPARSPAHSERPGNLTCMDKPGGLSLCTERVKLPGSSDALQCFHRFMNGALSEACAIQETLRGALVLWEAACCCRGKSRGGGVGLGQNARDSRGTEEAGSTWV